MLSPLQPRWSGREVRLGLLSLHPHVPDKCQVASCVGLFLWPESRVHLCQSESFGSDPRCASLFFSVPWGFPLGISVSAVCVRGGGWDGVTTTSASHMDRRGDRCVSHFVPWHPAEELLEAGRDFSSVCTCWDLICTDHCTHRLTALRVCGSAREVVIMVGTRCRAALLSPGWTVQPTQPRRQAATA